MSEASISGLGLLDSVADPSQQQQEYGSTQIKQDDQQMAESLEQDTSNMEIEVAPPSDERKNMKMLYGVHEVPPWYLTILLGLQQYMTMFSSTVTAPFIMAPALCIPSDHPARAYILSTIIFVDGLATLLQTFFGVRLPIVQGSSAAFYAPMFALMALPQWQCPPHNGTTMNEIGNYTDDIWESRMREIQGAISVASLLPIILSLTGLMNMLIHYITPLVVAPTITLIGLSMFQNASGLAAENWAVAAGTIVVLLISCLYMEKVGIPYPVYRGGGSGRRLGIERIYWFKLFPIITTILLMWLICYILTISGALAEGDGARTDSKAEMMNLSPWFKLQYPFQWGIPTVSVAGVLGMLAAMISSIVESMGDYYACARLSSAPNPPPHAISRGILVEGIGCTLGGVFGTGSGVTSLGDNIAAINITKVASRRVTQVAAVIMLLLGLSTKLGAVFCSIPEPVIGGLMIVMFGLIAAVGISNVQYIDLNSSRNLCILGFSVFFGMSLPQWINDNPNCIQTGNDTADEVITVLLSTNMLVGGFMGFILDNTVPGTKEERCLVHWLRPKEEANSAASIELARCYDLPIGMTFMDRRQLFEYLPFCPQFEPEHFECCSCKGKCKLRHRSKRSTSATTGEDQTIITDQIQSPDARDFSRISTSSDDNAEFIPPTKFAPHSSFQSGT